MEHPQGAGLGVGTTWMSVSMDEGGALIAQLRAIGRSASSHVAAALKLQVLHLREKREAKERLRRLRRLLKTAECEQPGQEEAQQELLGGLCTRLKSLEEQLSALAGSREGRREGSGFFWADSSFPKVKKFASASLGLLVNVDLQRYHYMAPSAQRSTSCKAALRRLTRPPRRPVIAPGCKRGLPRRMKRKKLNCRKSESNQSLDQYLTTCSLGEPNYGMLRVPRAAIDHTG